MKIIALITAAYLPGTFVAVLNLVARYEARHSLTMTTADTILNEHVRLGEH